jgi:signal transduction histidine kinase
MTSRLFGRAPLPILLMGTGTLILIALILASAWLAATTAGLSAQVVQARQIRIAASNALETLLNAETGQRGFLLSGNARYLAPFQTAASITRDLDDLDRLERDNASLRPSLARLRLLASEKMQELSQTVTLVQNGQRQRALQIVQTDRGIQVMDEARVILKNIISGSERTVSANLAVLNANARLLRAMAVVGGVLVILFSAAALWLVLRSVAAALRAREAVVALNTELEDRVLRRTAALTRANDEIQRFAYIVSHDLRAPLVNIMGFTSELEVGAAALNAYFETGSAESREPARQAATQDLPEAVKFIRSSTGKMDRLINAILKLSREGRRELRAERVDLNTVFGTIADSLKHQIAETGTTVDLSARLPVIVSDRLALEQIFGNLFDNALKYLQPGRPGHISVSAETGARSHVITVADNGRGIAENDKERVFELFRRAGKQDRPGEGIGLAHVRALARRLGGDITVTSRLGEGSQFRVILPPSLPSETGNASS